MRNSNLAGSLKTGHGTETATQHFLVTLWNRDGEHDHVCRAVMRGRDAEDVIARADEPAEKWFGFFDEDGECETEVDVLDCEPISDSDAEVLLRLGIANLDEELEERALHPRFD